MVSAIKKFNDALGFVEYAVTVPMFLGMLGLMFVQVIYRYFLEMPLPWSEELIRYAFISVSFLGGAIAVMERQHIEINFLETIIEKFKDNPAKHELYIKIANVFRDLAAAVFLSVVFYQTWLLVADQIKYQMVSPAMQMPLWIATGFMLAGAGLMILHNIINIILNLNGLGITGYEGEGGEESCSL